MTEDHEQKDPGHNLDGRCWLYHQSLASVRVS
jgi:hypothetical protein